MDFILGMYLIYSSFKQLKKLIIDVDNVDNPELGREVLSMEEKISVAQEATKIMKEELPIKIKASVYELLIVSIYWTWTILILIITL